MNSAIESTGQISLVDNTLETLAALSSGGNAAITEAKAKTLKSAGQAAIQDVLAILNGGETIPAPSSGINNSAPQLRAPGESAAQDIGSGGRSRLTELLTNVIRMIGNNSLQRLVERLGFVQANAAAMQTNNAQLQEQFNQAFADSQAAIDAADTAMQLLQNAKDNLAGKQNAYNQAQAVLDGLSPGDEGYELAQKNFSSAAEELTKATAQHSQAALAANTAFDTAFEKTLMVDELNAKAQGILNQSPLINKLNSEKELTTLAKMLLLIGIYLQLLGKSGEKEIKNKREFTEKLHESEQKNLQLRAKEHQEQIDKNMALNKAMGCVGKILGGLITLVSVIGAVFSGGASLALAAVGLALMLGDQIGKAITGVSFMEKALNPILEGVIKPMVEAIAQAITKMLKALGVNENIAAIVGNIVGSILAMVMMVAVVIIGKSAAGKVSSSMVAKMLTEAVKKIVPDVLKKVSSNSGALFTNGIKRVTEKMSLRSDDVALKSYANMLDFLETGAMFTTQAVMAGGGIAQGIYEKKALNILAKFSFSAMVEESIRNILKQSAEKLSEALNSLQPQWAALNEAQSRSLQTRMSIITAV